MTARTYRPRRVQLAAGGTLALRTDGAIHQLDDAGALVASWAPGEDGWNERAIRFGLKPQARTIHPSGRDVPNRIPPA